MNAFDSALPILGASCLVVGLFVAYARTRRTSQGRGFVELSPRYRTFFRQQGLADADDFLAQAGETPHIVSGHPDRHVARIFFGTGPQRWIAYLKREHHVRWRVRLGNALASFGLVSRSLRETRTLQILQRENIPAPEWLAVGEDGRGKAFLLVREVAGVELRAFLRAEKDPARRRRAAVNLGRSLARLHSAGFRHPDLYANHVFIDSRDGSIRLLDWQRARLSRELTWKKRQRDLAALHATLDDSLATSRERLLCLRAYYRASPSAAQSWRTLVEGIESAARRLLARRHIREKRQPPAQPQAWICLGEGETLCVTPEMAGRCAGGVPDWLQPERALHGANFPLTRRWPTQCSDGSRTLFVQRREHKPIAELWRRLRGRSLVTPEHRQAALLLRLERHAITAPRVLALGQRHDGGGRVASFLLTEPVADTCSLEAWLARQSLRRSTRTLQARKWSVLRQAGVFLRRLHAASCYLNIRPDGCGLAVRQAEGEVTVVLEGGEFVTPRRRRHRHREERDVRRLQRILREAGCSRTDLYRFRAAYRQSESTPDSLRTRAGTKNAARLSSYAETRGEAGRAGSFRFVPGRDSLWRRLFHGVCRSLQRPDWPRFAGADWPERIMDVAVTDRFHAKQGRSTGRWVLDAPGQTDCANGRMSVYLKRHYELPWRQRMLALLWPGGGWSPAMREWQHLDWARRQGIPVPSGVAAAEYIGPRGQLRSCLAVEELTGMLSLQEAIPLAAVRQEAEAFRHWKHTLASEMARLTRMLHDRRCFHKDLYLCHFFIARDDTAAVPASGWRGRVYLIDLHRLAHHRWTWRLWQTKDLAQLLYSSAIIGVRVRDRLAFWRHYGGTEARRGRRHWLRLLVLLRWQRYRLHNARNDRGRKAT